MSGVGLDRMICEPLTETEVPDVIALLAAQANRWYALDPRLERPRSGQELAHLIKQSGQDVQTPSFVVRDGVGRDGVGRLYQLQISTASHRFWLPNARLKREIHA